jgi:mannose-6-phosphate isomerase-like protein (cupin superfamily)
LLRAASRRGREDAAMAVVIKVESVPRLNRGSGIVTTPLVTHMSVDGAKIVTGISSYPRGEGAPLHHHNCDEQVTLLSGTGEVEIDGVVTPLVPHDSTYVEGGIQHAFRNTGEEPMVILWIYPADRVTRTFADTGETVEHLSAQDMMSADAGA